MSPLPPPPQAQPRIVPSASATPPTFLRILPSTPSSKLKSLPHHEASWLRLLFYLFIGSNAPVVLAQCVAQCSVNVPTNRAANKLLNQTKQPTKKPQTLGRPRTNLLVYPPNLQVHGSLPHRCSGLSLLGSPICAPMAARVAWKACQRSTNTSALEYRDIQRFCWLQTTRARLIHDENMLVQ